MSDRGSGIGERGSGIGDRGSALDRAIDGAVREMLDVEPRAGIRARVMRRIEHADREVASGFSRKDRFSRKSLWLGAPLAAAAAIAVAVLIQERTEQAPVTVAIHEPRPSPAPPAVPTVTPRQTTQTTAARRVVATPRPQTTRAVEAAIVAAAPAPAAEGMQIEPLASIAPIELAPIAEHRVAPAAITVEALNPIAEVQIAPLFSSARRN